MRDVVSRKFDWIAASIGRTAFLSSIKSPRWESPILVADRCFERERFFGNLQCLAHLFDRHMELLGELLRRRLAADLAKHLPARAHDLVDDLNHVHGDADGARLIGKRAADRLPNSPGGVSRKLVAAPVFELVDRWPHGYAQFGGRLRPARNARTFTMLPGGLLSGVTCSYLLMICG